MCQGARRCWVRSWSQPSISSAKLSLQNNFLHALYLGFRLPKQALVAGHHRAPRQHGAPSRHPCASAPRSLPTTAAAASEQAASRRTVAVSRCIGRRTGEWTAVSDRWAGAGELPASGDRYHIDFIRLIRGLFVSAFLNNNSLEI